MAAPGPVRTVARVIAIEHLTKRFGPAVAVDDLSFTVRPGTVTGFLGPNGAGKSTTLRVLVGLTRPDAGRATIGGRPYAELARPLRTVGTLLDARGAFGGRRARHHLEALAASNALPRARVATVLEAVGLTAAADARVRTFSLGMAQRLGLAAALLGDPEVLVLDEPVNGLDAEGIRWIRDLLRGLAAEGRTVLVSSHLMAEVERTVDHLVVLAAGRLVADAPVAEVLAGGGATVRVATPDPALRGHLEAAGARVRDLAGGAWRVSGCDAAEVGRLAAAHGAVLHELTPERSSLEDAFTALTAGGSAPPAGATPEVRP